MGHTGAGREEKVAENREPRGEKREAAASGREVVVNALYCCGTA